MRTFSFCLSSFAFCCTASTVAHAEKCPDPPCFVGVAERSTTTPKNPAAAERPKAKHKNAADRRPACADPPCRAQPHRLTARRNDQREQAPAPLDSSTSALASRPAKPCPDPPC